MDSTISEQLRIAALNAALSYVSLSVDKVAITEVEIVFNFFLPMLTNAGLQVPKGTYTFVPALVDSSQVSANRSGG